MLSIADWRVFYIVQQKTSDFSHTSAAVVHIFMRMRSSRDCGWDQAETVVEIKPKLWWDLTELWMRSCRVVRASGCQCRSRNSPGFDPSILRHSGIRGATDGLVLNTVHRREKNQKNPSVDISGFTRAVVQVLEICIFCCMNFHIVQQSGFELLLICSSCPCSLWFAHSR